MCDVPTQGWWRVASLRTGRRAGVRAVALMGTCRTLAGMTTSTITNRPVSSIARDIVTELARLRVVPTDYLAVYLAPLLTITDLAEDYGYDSAAGIAAYCVDALEIQEGWRGARSKTLSTELKLRVQAHYRN